VFSACVIVSAHERSGTLPRTLAALEQQQGAGDYTVAVVDGSAAERNRAVAESTAGVVAFLDQRCVPTRGWLAAGARALETAELVQGRVSPAPGDQPGPFDEVLLVTGVSGLWESANLFATRDVYDRAGGFEPWPGSGPGRAMAEGAWFGWRAIRAGARGTFCADALTHRAARRRGPVEFVVAHARKLRYFPAMVARMPELRDSFCYRRWFLKQRTAAFDLALAGLTGCTLLRSPYPSLAAAPYARMVLASAQRDGGSSWPTAAAAELAGDLATVSALAFGSVESRSLVL
jgi:hypothetical protein